MVFSIGSSNQVNLYINNTAPIGDKADSTISDSSEIVDEYIPAADYYYADSNIFNKYNSLESYKSARQFQLQSELMPMTSMPKIEEIRNNRELLTKYLTEYERKESLYKSACKSINYEAEFNDYMKARGCSNEEELQELNKTMFRTMDDLRNYAMTMMQSVFIEMSVRNPVYASAATNARSIISCANLGDLAEYVNSTGQNFKTTCKATQKLLSSIDPGKTEFNLSNMSADIDNLLKTIDEEAEESAKTGKPVDFSKYYDDYRKKMMIASYQK